MIPHRATSWLLLTPLPNNNPSRASTNYAAAAASNSQQFSILSTTLCGGLNPYDEDDNEIVDDDDDDDDDDPPSVDVNQFVPPRASFGLNRGRSSPSQRKAMGRSGSSTAKIYICSTCGSESVKWMGRCPTCQEWNTLQEHAVTRQAATPRTRPVFGGGGGSSSSSTPVRRSSGSWVDGGSAFHEDGGFSSSYAANRPVRVTDLYNKDEDDDEKGSFSSRRRRRIVVPNDQELNNVLGGGIMKGSLILLGGDPGVGKSTLFLQTAASVASLSTPTPAIGMGLPTKVQKSGNNSTAAGEQEEVVGPVWYVSGEENPDQISSRAGRLGLVEPELWLLSETHADTLCEQIVSHLDGVQSYGHQKQQERTTEELLLGPKPPSLVVVDSIQTMVCDAGGLSAAGGVTQVRECVALFLRLAKSTGIPILLVGHVTKSGDVAGPRTVEHMVDCVLYLEGTADMASSGGGSDLRMLRASKNRFGSSDEVGVYEMTTGRLLPVSDPSSLFLAHRVTEEDAEGCAIAIALEGRRAMTVEVQALVTTAGGGSKFGSRTVDGIANSRLMLLLGVLQKRCGIFFLTSKLDIYINVVGRIRLDRGEGNAADLAVAVALVSSLMSIPVRSDTAFVGEVGLLGELRPNLAALDKRLEEARRMGFSRVITARDGRGGSKAKRYYNKKQRTTTTSSTTRVAGLEWIQCENLLEAINAGLVSPVPKRKPRRRGPPAPGSISPPGSLEDLGLEEIMDDGNDDDDDFQ